MSRCLAVVPAGSYRTEGQCWHESRKGSPLCGHHETLRASRGKILLQLRTGRVWRKQVPA